jgi:hypothetical protein
LHIPSSYLTRITAYPATASSTAFYSGGYTAPEIKKEG